MDDTTVFSKTGKGLLEVKNRSNRITKEQYRILSLVDGKATLDDLAERTRTDPTALRQILSQLSDGGYIKVLVTSSSDGGLGTGANTGSYYVDDLDFTAVLGPASSARPSIYQSSETERRQRESAERKAAEAAATKRREEDEQRKRKEALRLAEEETQVRKLREEAQRKGLLEAQRQAKLEAEMKSRLDADRLSKDEAANALRAQAEAKLKADIDRQVREAAEARRREEEARRNQELEKEREERKRQEDIERRRIQEERKRAEEELRRQEAKERMLKAEAERRHLEEERQRKEDEERKRKEEQDRKRQEEARRRQEEEEKKRRDQEARKRREEEERVRREEEARRKEEERKRTDEEERKRREVEDRMRREEEARRKDEDRKRREAEERTRREEEERVRREEEAQRKEKERKGQEEADRKRKEEEARAQSEKEAIRKEAERKRIEEEERNRRNEEARLRKEEQDRRDAEARSEEEKLARREKPAPMVEWPVMSKEESLDEALGNIQFGYSDQSDGDTFATRLDLPEVIESEPPRAGQTTTPARPAAGGITQNDIRRALEEQERRLRMEEEARAALERAEIEAQLKAEREAREAAEAADKARREAELRLREESERLDREEKERREIEEQERRRQKEAERRAREQAHLETERRKREEELAHKRKEQEQRELLNAQKVRIKMESHRTQITPARVLLGGLLILFLMGMLVIQFATLNPWAPDVERIATQTIGEPVHVGSLRATVFPRVQLILEKVTVGSAQDVSAATVTLVPEIDSLFSETKILKVVEIQGLAIATEGLLRARGWLKGGGTKLVRVPLIKVREATLDLPGVALPSITAQLKLGSQAEVLGISAATMDDRLQLEFLPTATNNVEVSIKGHNFTMPVGPALEVMDLEGKGTIGEGELRMSRMEYFLFGGQGSAEATIRWQDGWTIDSTFDFHRLSLETGMRAFKIQVISDGALDAKGILRLRSSNIESLFLKPQIDASFTARRGNLAGFDIPRALQQRHRDGVQGGKTRFEELSGTLIARDGSYQYRQVLMTAGVLKSTGQVDISPTGSVSGRISAELRSSAGVVRGNFTVSGNDQATMLKP